MMPAMFLLLLACSSPPPPPSAASTSFDPTVSGGKARTVQEALNELYLHQREQDIPAAAPVHDDLAGLTAQLASLEMRLAAMEAAKAGTAEGIPYDPRATTLTARDVQSAITEMELRLEKLEKQDPGKPGDGLYELRDKHGNLVPPGKPNGPGGGPPGQPGQAGGQPPNGMPPNGMAPGGQKPPGGPRK